MYDPSTIALAAEEDAEEDPEDEDPEDERALEDRSVVELKELASSLEIEGRSGMNKDELVAAIVAAQG